MAENWGGLLDRVHLQLPATLLIVFFIPSNLARLLLLCIAWLCLFWPLHKKELIAFLVINIIFTINNHMAIQNGIFQFAEPDLFLLPYFEFVMWGFYLIHSHRVVKPKWPQSWKAGPIILTVLFSMCFSLSPNQDILLYSSSTVILLSTAIYRNKNAIQLGLYMIVLGALIEYFGVYFQLWNYPKPYPGGVAFWFATLWYGVGFYYYFILGPYYNDK